MIYFQFVSFSFLPFQFSLDFINCTWNFSTSFCCCFSLLFYSIFSTISFDLHLLVMWVYVLLSHFLEFKSTGGTGCCDNSVFPRTSGKNCRQICASTAYKNCDAELAINGFIGRAKSPYSRVGNFYNYGCDYTPLYPHNENKVKDDDIIKPHGGYYSFCCCRKW